MPGVETWAYGDVNSREGQTVSEACTQERTQRANDMTALWKWYHGEHPKPLKIFGFDDNVIVNWTGQAVNKLLDVCVAAPPSLLLPGGFDRVAQADGSLVSVRSDAQQTLDALWERAGLGEFTYHMVLTGLVTGHVFIKLLFDKNGEPSFVMLNPETVSIVWWLNAPDTQWYRIEWETGQTRRRQDIVPGALLTDAPTEASDRWYIVEYIYDGRRWAETGRDEWSYPFAPLLHAPHARYGWEVYGRSFVAPLAELNRAGDFVASNVARILRFNAHPRTIATGVSPDEIRTTSVDGLWTLPDGATISNLEMQSDLSSSMAYLATLKAEFFSQARVLDTAAMKDRIGALTNFGVRMLYNDMIANVRRMQTGYGAVLAELSRRALAMLNVDATLPKVTWADALPKNELEILMAIEKARALGVMSKQTASEKLGLDFEAEQAQQEEEGTEAADALANVMGSLGNRGLFGG